jgi:hypothetical protein
LAAAKVSSADSLAIERQLKGFRIDLYLMPYTAALRPHFSARELCDWAELITERGIRIRVPFENHFETRHDESILKLPEDEEPVEDELAFLGEIDGAKPYQ